MHKTYVNKILGKIRTVLSTRESRISRVVLALLTTMRGLLVFCGLYGAKRVPSRNPEVALLKLNRTTSLGLRGDLVELPSDGTISNFVRQRGTWELDECQFIASEIHVLESHMEDCGEILFLDIGANAGLISRQVRTLLDRDIEMILIEPIPLHVEVIRFNLSKFLPNPGIQIFQGALSDKDGTSKIYIQTENRGNTSLFKDAMLGHSSEEIQIDLIDTSNFSQRYLSHYSHIVLKSDTQGFDARILSLIPFSIWENIRAAVIEVWALPDIDENEISKLMSIWEKLPHLKFSTSSSPLHSLTLTEIRQFWGSKSGKSLNLRLTSVSPT
jgi:FkbM family methyltransferase